MRPWPGSRHRDRRSREPEPINLKILLPFRVFLEAERVRRIVVQTLRGSFGLLPNRLDCAAALSPGILTYEPEAGGEIYLAVDQGVLVKAGPEVLVSVRNAIGGTNLDQLHEAVKREFLRIDRQEQSVRSVMDKMEGEFVRRFMEFQHE
ncbi:F0F1 ATP synthase subunit epsilon [Tundrisphaera lichenicola]|uniref:F0F1 ATP synthase subunit epsilon n=1 Tax=Tundrisphaera lichenicola TaxID=2029860 RepID=UPI003EB75719